MVSKDRRHLFVAPCYLPTITVDILDVEDQHEPGVGGRPAQPHQEGALLGGRADRGGRQGRPALGGRGRARGPARWGPTTQASTTLVVRCAIVHTLQRRESKI